MWQLFCIFFCFVFRPNVGGDNNFYGLEHDMFDASVTCIYKPSGEGGDTTTYRWVGGLFAMSVFWGIGKKMFFMCFLVAIVRYLKICSKTKIDHCITCVMK